jgi:hypothetical protein
MSLKKCTVLAVLGTLACPPPPPPPAPHPPTPTGPQCVEWSGGAEGVMLGTEQSDEVLDMAVDAKGALYIAGYERGTTGARNIDPSGDARGFIAKVGQVAEGSLQPLWSQYLDTPGADTVEALAFHPETGELYFAGRTDGAFPGFTNSGQFDTVVGWASGDSLPQVFSQSGTERPQHPRRLDFTAEGDLIIGGYDDTYVPTNYVEAFEDPFVLRMRRQGDQLTEVWKRQFNTPYPDLWYGLAVDRKNGSALYSSGANLSGGRALTGMYVRRLDGEGNPAWSQRVTSIGYDMAAALHVREDGRVLMAGSTFAALGDAVGQQDAVVRLLEPDTGAPVWTVQYGSEESEWVTDMTVDAEGNIYVVGETLGAVQTGFTNQGDYDLFLLKLAPDGKLLHARQWGSASDDHPAAVVVDPCGRVFVAGYTGGNLFGTGSGKRDGFLLSWMDK